MRKASFIAYGRTEAENREVTFSRLPNGQYVVRVEGMPVLTVTHPSYERVKAAFEGYYQMSVKDYGPSELEWGDMGQKES